VTFNRFLKERVGSAVCYTKSTSSGRGGNKERKNGLVSWRDWFFGGGNDSQKSGRLFASFLQTAAMKNKRREKHAYESVIFIFSKIVP
jgi:hypothetical protein